MVQYPSLSMKYGLKSLLFTLAIFSSKYDIKPTFERRMFRERSPNFENGCKTYPFKSLIFKQILSK